MTKVNLVVFPQALFLQPPVRQKDEFERSDRALERHLGDMHHEVPASEGAEVLLQLHGTLEGVERVDVVGSLIAERLEAGGFVRSDVRPRSNDQEVVVEPAVTLDLHPIVVRLDFFDLGLDHFDPGWNEIPLRLDDVMAAVHAEWDEEKSRAGSSAWDSGRRR